MLQSFPQLRSRNIDEVKALFLVRGQDSHIDLPGGRRRSEFVANMVSFGEATLLFTGYGAPIAMGFDPSADFFLGYQVHEVSQVVVEGKVIENDIEQSGCLVPRNRPWCVRSPNGFQVLLLRLTANALQRRLAAFLGSERARLDLRQPSIADPGRAGKLRASVFDFADDVNLADRRFLPQLAANAIEDICLQVLTSLCEPVLKAERAPAAPSAVQLGRVEQHIVANFAKPLTVATLAEVSGVSARCVFNHFLLRYGCTPHEYLERVRLDMAHFMLSACDTPDAVAPVALQCGYSSLGHFERAYRANYGELPPPLRRRELRRQR